MDIGNTAPCKPGGEMFEHAADAAEVRGFLAGLAGLAGHEPGDGPAKIRAAAMAAMKSSTRPSSPGATATAISASHRRRAGGRLSRIEISAPALASWARAAVSASPRVRYSR